MKREPYLKVKSGSILQSLLSRLMDSYSPIGIIYHTDNVPDTPSRPGTAQLACAETPSKASMPERDEPYSLSDTQDAVNDSDGTSTVDFVPQGQPESYASLMPNSETLPPGPQLPRTPEPLSLDSLCDLSPETQVRRIAAEMAQREDEEVAVVTSTLTGRVGKRPAAKLRAAQGCERGSGTVSKKPAARKSVAKKPAASAKSVRKKPAGKCVPVAKPANKKPSSASKKRPAMKKPSRA